MTAKTTVTVTVNEDIHGSMFMFIPMFVFLCMRAWLGVSVSVLTLSNTFLFLFDSIFDFFCFLSSLCYCTRILVAG